jgi:apolipoprotein N-acyltransferase
MPKRLIKKILPSRDQWSSLPGPMSAAAFSGCLMALAFPPAEWGWVAFFGLVPFLMAMRRRSGRAGVWIGLAFGLPFFYINLFWLNTLSWTNSFAPIGVFLLAAFCALTSSCVFGAISGYLVSRRPDAVWIVPPVLWTVIEYLRGLGPTGFPWFYLGHTQVGNLWLVQICDLAGVFGVSFLIVAVNNALAHLVSQCWNEERGLPTRQACIIAIVALVFAGGYGTWRLSEGARKMRDAGAARLKIGMIQPGIPESRKLDSYSNPDQNKQYEIQNEMNTALTGQIDRLFALNVPMDLCVLPESAITYPYFNLEENLRRMVSYWSQGLNAPIFFGADRFVPAKQQTGEYVTGDMYNSAYLVVPDSKNMSSYDKMHLVPFGETSLFFRYIPYLNSSILGIGEFATGDKATVFPLKERRFGSVICFESCFSYLFRKYAEKKVDWMIVITNDAWYGLSSGARRHQTQSIFRAIEMRRPVVRVANTGISCIVDPWGHVGSAMPLLEGQEREIIGDLTLPASPSHSFYMTSCGDLFSWLCLLTLFLVYTKCQNHPTEIVE